MKNNESKYKQVVNFVIDGIAEGKLQKGDWIPSINEFRENYRLSRDTVLSAKRREPSFDHCQEPSVITVFEEPSAKNSSSCIKSFVLLPY